ncbi:glycoprotease family-domain-containing protein [Lipomyces japonicus]|uniref:glycoprotease family-domain-containing protein n=1 Tax=Lipomyces japonicus TaxID=56871 RepID=UPI0034CFAE2A
MLRPRLLSHQQSWNLQCLLRRTYKVLGIETSCDDTSLALYERLPGRPPILLDYRHASLNNSSYGGGIVPNLALRHHRLNLATLAAQMFGTDQPTHTLGPQDLICVTQGPGMPACLTVGLEFAKGLAIGRGCRLIGVHHMLAHLLTPRLLTNGDAPEFPYLSLLVSGGHTMLVLSSSVLRHEIVSNTRDIAIGDAVDKCARHLGIAERHMNGPALEQLARSFDVAVQAGEWQPEKVNVFDHSGVPVPDPRGITVTVPLRKGSDRTSVVDFSFAAFESMVDRGLTKKKNNVSVESRALIANQVQRAIFKHTAEKVSLAINTAIPRSSRERISHFVMAGGVASNLELRKAILAVLPKKWQFHCPPVELCTDNGKMIAWAGIELFEHEKLQSDLTMGPLPKWSLQSISSGTDWHVRESL